MKTNTQNLPQELIEMVNHLQRVEADRSQFNIEQLKEYISQHPSLQEKAQALSEEMEDKLLFYIASGDERKKARLKSEIKQLRDQLLGDSQPHIAEQLLAHEIVLSLILMRFADAKLIRHYDHVNSVSMRKMDAIHSRLMRSLKTYAAIKKAIPEFSINLTQLNLG